VRDGSCLPLIADTNIQQGKRPDSADLGLDCLQFMRLNDEQKVTGQP